MTQLTRNQRGRAPLHKALGAATLAAAALMIGATSAQAALTPPEPYVLAEDGVTRLTLEQAGILTPEGRKIAIALGKALFWDIQAGSDGMACASCHFNAGADNRLVNQLTPGLKVQPQADLGFGTIGSFDGELVPGLLGVTGSGANVGGADGTGSYVLQPGDFPMHKTTDVGDRNAPLIRTTNDAVSSSGAFQADFKRVASPWNLTDKCSKPDGSVYHAGVRPARQVEPRNTPTTINAVFNHRNFWDGRANNIFNGVGVFGPRDIAGDPNKRLMVLDNGTPKLSYLEIHDASLASQAVGPLLSVIEMACSGKTFLDAANDLLPVRPLRLQKISKTDSVLGTYVTNPNGYGFDAYATYAGMIKQAFDPKYWSAPGAWRIENGQLVKVLPSKKGVVKNGYSQMAVNFPMFWGISIMLYEATLVSDQSKFDDWFASCKPITANASPLSVPIGNPTVTCADGGSPLRNGMTEQEVMGYALFNNGGVGGGGIRNAGNPACSGCHPVTNPNANPLVYPLFSEAQFQAGQNFLPVERSRVDSRGPGTPTLIEGALHDRGFFNIGARPSSMDLGNGGLDDYGNPLSIARMFALEQQGQPVVEPTGINPCTSPGLIEPGGTPRYPCDAVTQKVDPAFDWHKERHMVDGTVKTPSIRNVALTPPYFVYGGYSDLRTVVEFYARGGNQRDKSHVNPSFTGDTSGTGALGNESVPVNGPDFGTNIDFFIRDIDSTDEQIDAIVAFMKTVTDSRVQCDRAPFDHPGLPIPNGHVASSKNPNKKAEDIMAMLPEVGAAGYDGEGKASLCIPNSGDLFDPALQNRLTPMKK